MPTIYTAQLAKWRKVESLGIPIINTTVKSGDKAFSPTWDMVLSHKSGVLSDVDYTARFYELMRQSYKDNRLVWNSVLDEESIAFMCYCRAGKFCHRHLLTDICEKICRRRNIQFLRGGEIV